MDQRLHRGQVERRAEPADHGPEDDDRGQPLREHHRDCAERVEQEADHVGALAAEEVAELAADQDERGGDERLDCDGRLDAAHGRVEVLHHRRDRHVHERRVDHEHEHRGRQEDADEWAAARLVGGRARALLAQIRHRVPPARPQRAPDVPPAGFEPALPP